MKTLIKKNKNKGEVNYKLNKDRSILFIRLSIIFFFIGIILCASLYSKTIIHLYAFSRFYIAFSVIGFLIPFKYYTKWFQFIKYEIVIFNIIGSGPLLTGLFLLFNYYITTSTTTNKYKIEKIYFTPTNDYGIILEKNKFSTEPKIVEIKEDDQYNIYQQKYFKLILAKGIFGYQVIKNRTFEE